LGKLLRFCFVTFVCALISTFVGCGSAVTIDGEDLSGSSSHSDDHVIIQTRLDGEHLDVFTLGQPILPDVSPHVFTQKERERDYLAGRSDGTLGRNINGNIYRYPIDWDMSTDQGTTTGSRVSLDGGDGAYITDYAVESVAGRVTFPTADGTYYYDLSATNSKGYGPVTSRHTYTRSGNTATLTWRDPAGNVYTLYSGAPPTSWTIGFGFLINNAFASAPESIQDSRYTGTWTVTQNLNGVEGTTGKFDLRRIGVANLQVDPAEFNPVVKDEATIRADIVALPVSTELTPDGWAPSGPLNWRIEVKDPLNLQSNVRVFNGSVTATSPDANGKIGAFTQAWNGEDSSGELLVNSTYPIRAQATGSLSAGNILSKEAPTQIMIGALGVKINDLKAEPRNFNPAEGETTTVSFGIEAIGFEDPNLSWEVEVYQNDIRLHSFPVGEALNTSTKDVAIEWDGSTALGPLDGGSFEYRVRATACENGVEARSADPVRQRSLFQVSGGFCSFATDVTEGGITAIEIKNPLVTPDPPFEEPGTTADLTAEIVVSNPQVYRIFWEVGIKDAEGEVVIPEIARGTGSDLLAKWDGIVDPGEDPLTYQFAITAYGCPEELGPDHQPDPETCPLIAKEDVPVGKSLEKLFVEFSGNVVAFGYDQDDDDSQGTLRKTRQEYSRELQRFVGNGATLDFSLEGLLTKPAAVTVQVASSISGQSDTAVLTDEDKDGVYTGSLTLPSNFIQPATGTSYNTGVVYTESGTDRDFADSAMPAYPSPIKLGGYRENLLNPEIEQDSPDEVTTDILSLAELGFENLTIKVVSPATINVETDLNVPNPAKVVAWTFHGYGDGTLLPQNEIGIFVPGANEDVLIPNLHISSGDTQLMDTLFLSACNALNLQNYNQLGHWRARRLAWLPDNRREDPPEISVLALRSGASTADSIVSWCGQETA